MAPRLAPALAVALAAGAIVGTTTAQCGASTTDPFVPTAGATFHEGSGDGSDYSSSQTCWTKLSCPGQRVTLDLITFATERDYDKLMMFEGTATGPTNQYSYEGATISCKLPAEWHGDGTTSEVDTDADITSDGEYLWLKFTSDEATEAAGYSASFSCACGTPTYETACTGNNGIPNLSNAALTCPYEPGVQEAPGPVVSSSSSSAMAAVQPALALFVALAAAIARLI